MNKAGEALGNEHDFFTSHPKGNPSERTRTDAKTFTEERNMKIFLHPTSK